MINKERRVSLLTNEKAQVWIETVLYTLIGLVLIGLVLAYVTPKIAEMKDKNMVEQAIGSLSSLDEKISDIVLKGRGNVRTWEISMKRGELYINSTGNEIKFVLTDLAKPYSEPGQEIRRGNIIINSTKGPKSSSVYLALRYNLNITYDEKDGFRKFTAASVPYKFFIENRGDLGIDLKESSSRGLQ